MASVLPCPLIRLDFQHLGARCRFQLTGVDGHSEHAVVTDCPGEFQEPLVAKPRLDRLKGGVVDPVLLEELLRELDDLGILWRHAARVLLTDGRDGRLRHALPACTARLRAPYIDRLELPGGRHRGEHPHPHIERALEADKGPEMRDAASEFRTVEEHREWSLKRAPAPYDGVHDGVVLGGHLVLAGDGSKPCHSYPPYGVIE